MDIKLKQWTESQVLQITGKIREQPLIESFISASHQVSRGWLGVSSGRVPQTDRGCQEEEGPRRYLRRRQGRRGGVRHIEACLGGQGSRGSESYPIEYFRRQVRDMGQQAGTTGLTDQFNIMQQTFN